MFNQAICDWESSKVTRMDIMFAYTRSINQPIGDWDISQVGTMSRMFVVAVAFNQPIDWVVSEAIMSPMFRGASA